MNAGDEFAVVACGVSKSFPTDYRFTAWLRRGGKPAERRPVLREIDLAVRRGEIFGLLGANGAGKTTLLKLLVTLLLPDGGTIRIDGIDPVAHPLKVKRHVGFALGGERTFYKKLTARRNLEFFGTLAELDGPSLERRIGEVVEIVDLGDALDRQVMGFSSGMLQRLAVARALLPDPPILIFDEPTRAVDPVHALEVRALIRDTLARELGKTVLLSTNLLEEAWSCCERVAILNAGRIVAVGSPEALVRQYAGPRGFSVAFAVATPELERRLRAIPGVASVTVEPSADGPVALVTIDADGRALTDLLAAIAGDGNVVRSLREAGGSPFDVFLAATRNESDAGLGLP